MSDASRPARRLPAWAPLAATCLGQGMVVLDATIVNVALPAIRRSLHLSATDLQWVVNAYLLTLGGLILLGGRIGDHYGRKRVYLIGGAIFSLASLAGGFAPSGGVLLGARAVQGVGAALLAPGTLSLLDGRLPAPARAHARARRVERDLGRRRGDRHPARRRPHERLRVALGAVRQRAPRGAWSSGSAARRSRRPPRATPGSDSTCPAR